MDSSFLENAKHKSFESTVFGNCRDKGGGFGLRMAPMIDVVFLLLIFFLVASKWRPQENFLPLRLPSAEAAGVNLVGPDALIIHIGQTQDGCIVRLGQKQAVLIKQAAIEQNLAALLGQMKTVLDAQKRFASDPIEIVCESEVEWDYLAKIYNVLYGAGCTDITFALTRERQENVYSD